MKIIEINKKYHIIVFITFVMEALLPLMPSNTLQTILYIVVGGIFGHAWIKIIMNESKLESEK